MSMFDDLIPSASHKVLRGAFDDLIPPNTSGWESFGRGIVQGATLGGADEIYAGVKAAQSRPNRGGRTPSTPQEQATARQVYEHELSSVRAANDRASESNPWTYFGGQLAGGMATAPVLPVARGASALSDIGAGMTTGVGYSAAAGFASGEGDASNRLTSAGEGVGVGLLAGGLMTALFRGAKAVRRAYANQGEDGAYGSIADDLPNGVDAFADEVAAGPSRNNITTNRRTLDILGEEMQRANGNVQAAQQATIARIAQEANVTPQTAAGHIRRLADVHDGSSLMLGEYPSVAGSDAAQRLRQPGNVNLDDLARTQDSTTQGTIDYLANNGNAQSAANVRNALSARQETLSPAMRATLESFGPRVQTGPRTQRPATIVDTADMLEHARQLGTQEYQAAYNGPINNNIALHVLPRLLQRYDYEAAGRSGEAAAAMRRASEQFYITTPNGQRVAMNTLQQLQDARGALRGQMSEYARAGRGDLSRVVQPMYQRITRLMEAMSPQWAVANRRWAGMRFDEVAQELGDAFAEKAGPRFREQVAEFQRMAPQAQNIVRVHVLQKLFDKLDNLPDTHSVSKLFSNDQSRSLIRTLFGDEAVVTFTRAVRDQRVAEASRSMTQNSATHRRGIAQRQRDAETGLVGAVEGANATGIRNWLLERATQLLTERRNRPMAEILTTPLSDTAAVARHIHNMRTQQQRLRRIDEPSRIQVPAVIASGTAPAQASADRREPDNYWPYPPPMRLGGPKPDSSNPDDPMWIPGTAASEDFWKDQTDKMEMQRRNDAILSHGDTVLIPGLSEIGSKIFAGISNAGDAMLAFGPMGEALSGPMNYLSAATQAFRNGGRAAVAAAGAGERALSKPTPEQTLMRLRTENDALVKEGNALGVRPGDMPDIALTPEEEINMLSAVNDAMSGRIKAVRGRLDRTNAMAPKSSVPSVDGYTPMAERADVTDWLARNPYTQAIKGRQGFPSKNEQQRLTNKFFDRGGRLPAPGPWGRDLRAAVQYAIENANRTEGRTGRVANRPSVGEVMQAWRGARDEAAALAKQLADLKNDATPQAVEALTVRLSEVTQELEILRAAHVAARRRVDGLSRLIEENKDPGLPPPEASQSKPPRIYKRGAE
jgi:hypothetical protein